MDNMNCEKCSELLLDYIDGELAPEEKASVEAHVKSCAECAREYEDYGEIRRAVTENSPLPEPSPEVLAGLSKAARDSVSDERRPFWKKWSYSPILVPALSSAIAISVWLYYGNTQNDFPHGDAVSRDVMANKVEAPRAADRPPESRGTAAPEAAGERAAAQDPSRSMRSLSESEPVPEEMLAAPAPPGPEYYDARTFDDTAKKSAPREQAAEMESHAEDMDVRAGSGYSLAATDYAKLLENALRRQRAGDCDSTIVTIETLLKSSPEPPANVRARSYRSLAECYEKKGKPEKAVHNYRQLREVSPKETSFANSRIMELEEKEADTVAATPAPPTTTPAN